MKRGTNYDVCTAWAEARSEEQHGLSAIGGMQNSSGSLYFIGPTIYSYGRHYPIAHWVDTSRENPIVFVNTTDSTPTTNGHKGDVTRALSNMVDKFYVCNVFASDWEAHDKNFQYMLGVISATRLLWSKARSNKPFYYSRLQWLAHQANTYRHKYMHDGQMINLALVAVGAANPLVRVVVSE